ncbi:MAG: acyl-CoA carboxylase subunit beta [Bacteriovoracaceae bacterium]|jgi:acyl-CoA carboxylase subunit beta|nr:acyl-CoA carboxylase subunit beta [Bacteriovoracaceae bacterium]
MKVIESQFNLSAPSTVENYQKMMALCDQLAGELEKSRYEGPEKYVTRHRDRGKLLARQRVQLLLDRGSPFLELMPLAGWGRDDVSVGGSLVIGMGMVKGVLCMVNANIPTVKGGALNEVSVQKSRRMDEIALENRIPVIYLTESAGADLNHQAQIFNYGGRAFREITRRSKKGIPSITIVFGSSTAGGAYIPGMSDYVVMVKEQAKTYLAGPPLVKMALGEDVDDETLGGASMHAKTSGLADYIADDEKHALCIARDIVSNLNLKISRNTHEFEEPRYPAEDLLSIVSSDVKIPFDPREVIARLVDDSKFSEFKPLYGETLITGFAKIYGHQVGILTNSGVIFSESSNKAAHFIQLCNKQGTPLLFLQNITGFMVGKDAESGGIIKNGAKLINAVSNAEVPAITILMGSSYGAGNYGMCGRAYDPRFLFSWPNSKLAVMGAEQLTGVMEIIQEQKSKGQGVSVKGLLDKGKMKLIKEGLRKKIEQESSAYYGSSRVWDDGIIDPRDTRKVLSLCLTAINQIPQTHEGEWGVFRM